VKQVGVEEALTRRFPEWVVWVVSRSAGGQPNIMPAGWCMLTAADPKMIAVAIAPGHQTHQNIVETKEFVVAWAGHGQEDLIRFYGARTGTTTNKFEELKIETAPANTLCLPIPEGVAAAVECTLVDQLQTGDHTLFVGKAIAGHVPDEVIARVDYFGGDVYASPTPTQ